MGIRWRPIPEYYGYEISETGIVRSWLKNGAGQGLRKRPRELSVTHKRIVRLYREGQVRQVHIGTLLREAGWLDEETPSE